jgi:hypothetical protein
MISQCKVYLLQLVPVSVSLIMLAAYFCQSPRIKGRENFNNMNVKLLAASALLVQSGALMVSHNCFINFFAIFQC